MRNKEGTLMPETVILRKMRKGSMSPELTIWKSVSTRMMAATSSLGRRGRIRAPMKLTNFFAREEKARFKKLPFIRKLSLYVYV